MTNKYSRRKVMLGTVATAAATLLVSSKAYAMSKGKKKLGIALVGLGHYSRDKLAPALLHAQYCELKGIVTGSPEKIPVWKEKYGLEDKNIYNYENMHEIANNPDIDVVYVVVPTSLHKKFTLIAANAGKHVWCEKPMAMTASDCQEMIRACKKNNVQLAIGYRLHHEPVNQTFMDYALSLPYGKIKSLDLASAYYGGAPQAGDWRGQKAMGGGALYDMGVYAVSAARYASGMEPIAVTAQHETTRTTEFTEVDETTRFTLEFPNNVKASAVASVGLADVNHLRVDCEKGWYELEPLCDYLPVHGRTSSGLILDKTVPIEQTTQMDNEALAIMNGRPPIVPGEIAMQDIRIIEAIFKAASTGGRIKI